MRFNTFDQVAYWYNNIKPLGGKDNVGLDIRPIGERRYKHSRIKKYDEDTYALLDGCYTSRNNSYGGRYEQYEQDMAPIMWKREAYGDYIYIRNGTKNSVLFTRYQFLQRYLPTDLPFQYNQQGKHWVRAKTPTGWEDFPLPKTAYVWKYALKEASKDDGKRLKFRVNEDGTFTRVGEAFKVEVTTVDKELKKQWKVKIDAFYIQAAALAPMLDTSWEGKKEYYNVIADWAKERGFNVPHWGGMCTMLNYVPSVLNRQIVEQEDHELRIPLIALMLDNIGGKGVVNNKNELMKIKSAYNRLMNKLLGMYEMKEV
jgi:hypothetical protein